MKKFIVLAILLGLQAAHADTFTDDWYTSCQKTAKKSESGKDVQINGKIFKIESISPISGTSVFLGKDVSLAQFLLKGVLSSQCSGLTQGVGTAMTQVGGRSENPYTELRRQNSKDANKLNADALELLISVNSRDAAEILQGIKQNLSQQK